MANPLLEERVLRLRDPQTKAPQFRETLKEIGYMLGLDISRDLATRKQDVYTQMNERASHDVVMQNPVLLCLLRAGLPLYLGLQDAFPHAQAGFVGTARDERTLKSTISYEGIPDLHDQDVIVIDTMIATSGSMLDAIANITHHAPRRIIVAGAIASEYAIAQLESQNFPFYVAAIDPTLNDRGFIVPGLGDAGDRCYGEKVK